MPTLAEEFAAFWAVYPRRVSRQEAMKAYGQARVTATAEEILAGARAYLDHLPEEMRYVPYAASWLRASRWTDQYEALPIAPPLLTRDWFDECKELHDGQCEERLRHAHRMRMDAFKAEAS